MNSPMLNNVTSFNRIDSADAEPAAVEQAAPFDHEHPHKTMPRGVSGMLDRMISRFKKSDGGVLFIDHEAEDIRNTFSGVSEWSGVISLKHGVKLSDSISAPNGVLKAPGHMVIIAEGATVVFKNIECARLINFGTYEGGATATDLLVNYGKLSGDFHYKAFESAGSIRGSFNEIE